LTTAAGLPRERDASESSRVRAAGFTDAVTTHVIPMRKHDIPLAPDHHVRRRAAGRGSPTNLRNVHDVYYIIDLIVGNQTIPVSVDTGSSDTWLVQEPYECVSFWFDYPGGVSPPLNNPPVCRPEFNLQS
jgi:hypothetical protein